MLDEAANRKLSEVGPGTPMGELMRRYWHPIAAVAELDDHPTKAVRLMGEDLALYKDLGGRYGLLDRHCAPKRRRLAITGVPNLVFWRSPFFCTVRRTVQKTGIR